MGGNAIAATYTDRTGESVFNEAALFVRPHWLCTQPDIYVFPGNAPVGSASPRLPMPVSHEAPFLGTKFLGWGNTPVFVQIYDRALQRYIARAPIHADSISGVAGNPFYLIDPLWIEAGDQIDVRFSLTQVGGAAGDQVKFYVEGARYFAKDSGMKKLEQFVTRKREEHLRNYLTFRTTTVSPVVLPAGAPGPVTPFFLSVPDTYWFTVRKITAVTLAGNALAPGSFNIQFFDHRGNAMSNQPMSNITLGVGQNPEVLRWGWTIPPGRRIRMVMQDLAGAGLTFYMTFTGAAHYVKEE